MAHPRADGSLTSPVVVERRSHDPRRERASVSDSLAPDTDVDPSDSWNSCRSRANALTAQLAAQRATLPAQMGGRPYPRVLRLDTELLAAHTEAELTWVS